MAGLGGWSAAASLTSSSQPVSVLDTVTPTGQWPCRSAFDVSSW
jgi:hypothetical protein